MSHPPSSLAQRQFSPPQASAPSPNNATTPTGFSLPPSKRPKVSPVPPFSHSQPTSPYVNPTSYAASPMSGGATPTTNTGLPSPPPPLNATAANTQLPQGIFNNSHSNGRFAPMAPTQIQSPVPVPQIPPQLLRQAPQATQPRSQTAIPPPVQPTPQYTQVQLAPMSSPVPMPAPMPAPMPVSMPVSMPVPMPATTNMGPPTIYPSSSFSTTNETSKQQPSRPAPSKNPSYDVNDMLMGTGIDLEEEADIQNSLESRPGFPHLPASGGDGFYGVGSAGQPSEPTDAKTQEEYAAIAADRAWNEAAHRLAVTQSQEARHHLLEPGVVHKRIHDMAQKFGLGVNIDLKPEAKSQYMGKVFQSSETPQPMLKVTSQSGPPGTTVTTYESFIPKESYLIDQIALLSLGTRERLRDLLSDANKIAVTRQKSSHGVVPPEWADVAASPSPKLNGVHSEDTPAGVAGAVSPHVNPLKRSFDSTNNGDLPTPVSDVPPPNNLVVSLVELGKQSQDIEESRLRKRQKRLEQQAEKNKEGADSGSRAGGGTPGAAGSTAADGGDAKPSSKKEGKKAAAAKAAESNSGTTVNATLNLFTGGNIKRKYLWMTSTTSSGTSTPRAHAGSPGGKAGKAGRGPLTKASVAHLGQFREDSDKGKNIQLRDWIATLEDRGLDTRSLQVAYSIVDKSDTGLKVATEKS